MKLNLQYFGGRGASSSASGNTPNTENGIQAIIVTTQDGVRLEYEKRNGKYYSTTSGIPDELPEGITFETITTNVKKQGGKVEKLTPKDFEKREKKRKKEREETDAFLNKAEKRNRVADLSNKAYRNTRKATRIAKRRR